jgi:hypothetical protein
LRHARMIPCGSRNDIDRMAGGGSICNFRRTATLGCPRTASAAQKRTAMSDCPTRIANAYLAPSEGMLHFSALDSFWGSTRH